MDSKQQFSLTLHCTSKAHCKVCRNLNGGRKWRLDLGNTFELPEAAPGADPADFECPYGIAWGITHLPAKAETVASQTPQTDKPKPPCRNCGDAPKVERQHARTGGCGCSKNK